MKPCLLGKLRPGLALGLAAWLGACGGSSGGGTPAPNTPPVITFGPGAAQEFRAGQELRFQVVVTDPDGDNVSLTLLNPPSGMSVTPLTNMASPLALSVRWLVPMYLLDDALLQFVANDVSEPANRVRGQLRLRCTGTTNEPALRGDVTGDGIPDVVARAQLADAGLTLDTGALGVWAGAAVPSGIPTAVLRVPGALAGDRLGFSGAGQSLQVVDWTGDGVLDVIACTSLADVGGTVDTGAVYVWTGGAGLTGTLPPTTTLLVPGAVAFDQLGLGTGQGLLAADVSADGIMDLVVSARLADVGGVVDAGAIYVWLGGLGGVGPQPPSAVLSVPGGAALDRLGFFSGQGVQTADVTGDGVLDVVSGTMVADVGGVVDAGALYVWRGGTGLLGALGPTATLTVPGAAASDALGNAASGYGVQVADVTGDGNADLIGTAATADVGGVVDAGALYVWAGGAGLAGAPAPTATLSVPGAAATDRLGAATGNAVQFADVSGDGRLDVVAMAQAADVAGVPGAGEAYVWAGGPGLLGTPVITARLRVPGAVASDQLGLTIGQSLVLGDLTGDLVPDVTINAALADVAGVVDAGAIYTWVGGATLSGTPVPLATLTVPGATAVDQLGNLVPLGVQLHDVTGDGVLDVISGSVVADVGGVMDAGSLYVWAGGAALTGTPAPQARLAVPGAVVNDRLSQLVGCGVRFNDVTGDGVLDLVTGTRLADVGGVADTGALYLWAGGATLAGSPPPLARLAVPGAIAGDRLGEAAGLSLQVRDVTGDGREDIVAGSPWADAGGVADVGALYVWIGGAAFAGTMAPSATLTIPGAVFSDRLTDVQATGFLLGDVTGDGVPDILGLARLADVGGVLEAGALYAWKGGAGLAGGVAPSSTLVLPGALPGDMLGN